MLPYAYNRRDNRDVLSPSLVVTDLTTEETALGVDIGVTPNRNSQFRIGRQWGRREYSPRGGGPLSAQGGIGATTFQFTYDGQDDPIVPFRGLYSQWRGAWYDNAPLTDNYGQFTFLGWQATPLSRRAALHITLLGGRQTNGDAPLPEQFPLGGPFRLTSYFPGELRGEQFTYGSIGYLHQITPRSSLLGGAFYFGGWLETAGISIESRDPQEGRDWVRRRDLHFSAFAPTRLGPIAVGFSFGDAGKRRVYFRFGRIF